MFGGERIQIKWATKTTYQTDVGAHYSKFNYYIVLDWLLCRIGLCLRDSSTWLAVCVCLFMVRDVCVCVWVTIWTCIFVDHINLSSSLLCDSLFPIKQNDGTEDENTKIIIIGETRERGNKVVHACICFWSFERAPFLFSFFSLRFNVCCVKLSSPR